MPYVELVGLLCLDGDAVALASGSGTIARLLPPVVSPRRQVVLQADDLAAQRRSVQAITVVARPRWGVDVGRAGRIASGGPGPYAVTGVASSSAQEAHGTCMLRCM
ncbi:hypothetical protein [Streptomyces sp. H27-C3]|uniref:hypothetical protein n=1 Tax=Streptomyces sp. H27-C3 TaxID=3046305 RepID=UPI0024B8A8F7|nr:hypothetical protein [Streptomyces sp. H27-C3]MDJ0463484.1 hypothetical protein [Streptomyces sp. H27-C3]